MLSVNRDSFTFPFSIFMYFFSCLIAKARAPSPQLVRVDTLAVSRVLGGGMHSGIQSLTIRCDVSCRFFRDASPQVKKFFFIVSLLRVFTMSRD